jgi:hypothetical protein
MQKLNQNVKLQKMLMAFCMVWLIFSVSAINVFALSITNVTVSPSTFGAQLAFQTDSPANTGIEYTHQGTLRETLVGFGATTHASTLAGLLPATSYPYTIWARANGTEVTYTGTFTTIGSASSSQQNSSTTQNATSGTTGTGLTTSQNSSSQTTFTNLTTTPTQSGSQNTSTTTNQSSQRTMATNRQPFVVTIDESNIPSISTRSDVSISGTISSNANVTAYAVYEQSKGEYDSGVKDYGAGTFSITVPLDEGNNKVLIVFTDTFGQKFEFYREIFVDSEAPRILEHNLAELSPAYSSIVKIKGRVSKPNIDVRIYVNPKALKFQCSRGIDLDGDGQPNNATNCEDTDEFVTVRSDAQGFFEREVSLFGVTGAFFSNLGVQNIPNIQTTASGNFSNTLLDNQQGFGAAFSTVGEHKVRIVAIDRVGQSDEAEGIIIQAACGRGSGEWVMTIGEMHPAAIQPDHVFNGIAQISFSARLDFTGPVGKESVEVVQATVRPQVRSAYDQAELSPQELLSSSSCRVYPPTGIYDEIYVVCNLNSWPPERFRNMTRAYEMLEEYRSLDFPLQLEFSYSYTDRSGQVQQNFHKECLDVSVLVDRRLSPDKIPRALLNSSVTLLDDSIKSIDAMLGPLNTIKMYTTFACFGSTALNFFQAIGEAGSCIGVKQYEKQIEGFMRGLPESDSQLVGTYCNQYGDNKNACMQCASAIQSRISSEKLNQLVCDRIFCPAIPSRAEYIRQQGEGNIASSACLPIQQVTSGEGGNAGSVFGNYWYASTTSTDTDVRYSSGGSVPAGFSKEFGCGKEYDDKWSSACLFGFDAFTETVDLETNGPQNRSTSFFNSLGICRHTDDQDGPDFFRANGNVYCKAEGSTCYTICNDLSSGDFERTQGGQRTYVADPETLRQHVRPAIDVNQVGATQSQCVETSTENGMLIYSFADPAFTSTTNPQGVVKFNPSDAEPIPVERRTNLPSTSTTATPQGVLVTKFTTQGKGTEGEPIPIQGGVDSQGNYYKSKDNGQSWEKATSANNNDGFLKIVVVDSMNSATPGLVFGQPVAGSGQTSQGNSYGVFADKPNPAQPKQVVRGPENLRPNQAPVIIKDPTSSFINALQCGCLPAIEGYLLVIRNVLSAIRNCFNSILVTGEFNSGICRAVLTQYLCDWIWEALKCAWNAADRMQTQDASAGRQTGGLLSGLGSMGSASQKISTSMQQRYGGTASFNALINQRKLLHSVCLAAFGYDWLPELDLATSIQGEGFSINTTGLVQPATRRFVSTNPTSGGEVTYIYHVGYFLAAGAEITYRLELICSADNSCRPEDGFEGGRCDCSYPGSRGEEILMLDGGSVSGGRTLGGGTDNFGRDLAQNQQASNGQGEIYRSVTAPIRYDTVRLSWVDRTGGSSSGEIVRQVRETGATPRTCFFNAAALRFACNFQASNRNGDVYFVGDNPIAVSKQIYNLGDAFGVTVNARQDFAGVEPRDQVSKFAQLQILKDSQVLATELTLHDALAFPPVSMGTRIRLGVAGGTNTGSFALQSRANFGGLPILSIGLTDLDSPRYSSPRRQYVFVVQNSSDIGKFLKDDKKLPQLAESSKICAYVTESLTGTAATAAINLDILKTKTNTVYQPCTIATNANGIIEIKLANTDGTIRLNQNNPTTIDKDSGNYAVILDFTKPATIAAPSQTLCSDPNLDRENLIARVTLHHGRLLDENRATLASNIVPERSIASYNGAPQQREIRFTVICDPNQSAQTGGQLPLSEAQIDQIIQANTLDATNSQAGALQT